MYDGRGEAAGRQGMSGSEEMIPKYRYDFWVRQAGLANANVAALEAENADLRAALEDLLSAYEDGTDQCACENGGWVAPAPCTSCKARAAIAKARGEEGEP